ncbi:MBL fold metallo-hydrolase [Actinosynnema pretiosum subsp. pretiosum]|uniref:Beta-lactamase domain protein n=2 Tax=Actinosynnema TaxID=40566 RepID=C6WNX6_ACTMD|nr:MBL fold metallo-hydrolase [Actinosynnema mirum]ACU36645.1 beta-lactamase domain protein [Actinosynnema mirum DSM 43827]AXX30101.1 metallo-beta-lactamase-like protein [Actinosynnema pretiosum subsp. pretiosum]QUF05732.1 MBL fold metallo-hydrolase [Actinosynnema pretiosum subsp. pretiosum]
MRLGPHLHRIGNDVVAAYLIVTDEGITVVDAGMAGHWRDLLAELESIGRGLADVRGVVLTHGDTDHIGFAERLRRDHGVPVHVHPADAARARGEVKSKPEWGGTKLGPLLGFLWYGVRKGGLRTTYLTEVVEVHDGQVLDLPGAPRVIALPGHSPGSLAVHVPIADALLVGDALTTRHVLTGELGPRPAPFTDEPERALESLARLADVEAKWVLPGHGAPWSNGVPAALAAVGAARG